MPLGDIWSWERPLNRYKGETYRANAALQDYVDLGPGRSLRRLILGYRGETPPGELPHSLFSQYGVQSGDGAVIIPPTKRFNTVGRWSSDFQWQARLARYGELQNDQREKLREGRRVEIEELDWGTGGELRAVAREFLEAFPKFIKTTTSEIEQPDGSVIKTVTLKMNTTISQVSQAAKTASELQRLSINEPTEIKEIRGAALLGQLAAELDDLATTGKAPDLEPDDDAGTEDVVSGDPGSETDNTGTAEGLQGDPAV